MVIAGVMSGSSLDGLDIAVVRFGEDNHWDLLWVFKMPYTKAWESRLRNYHILSCTEYVQLKTEYSRYIAQCLLEAFKFYPSKIDFIGFHGHTLIHLPNKGVTEQIGNGGILAALVNIPTVTDFRVQDVAKGGVGTPLAPLVESLLFPGHNYYLNLGGIANITTIASSDKVSAFDVCPCNQILNHFSNLLGKEFDEDGLLARQGSGIAELIDFLNTIPYFHQNPPKSLDNNWIQKELIPHFPEGRVEDILHTYTHWMANCIAKEVKEGIVSSSLMVSGGGAHNIYFMECLKEALSKKNCSLYTPSEAIIDYKEAILMALMARNYLISEPNVMSSVTGASSDSIGGALYKVLD